MSSLVTAIADLVKTFCSGVVSLVTVPAQALQKFLWFRCLCFAACVFVAFHSFKKKKRLKA